MGEDRMMFRDFEGGVHQCQCLRCRARRNEVFTSLDISNTLYMDVIKSLGIKNV